MLRAFLFLNLSSGRKEIGTSEGRVVEDREFFAFVVA
jgi:hypothetical protein